MKSQFGIKKFLEKIGSLALLALLLFACAASPETPKRPVVEPTKTKPFPAPSSPKNNNPPIKNFSLQNANKIAPDDILEEVAFGGRGGPGDCDKGDPNYPAVDERQSNPNAEWLAPISVVVCGWSSDSIVEVNINLPDGGYYTDTVKVEEKTIVVQETKTASMPYIHYYYYPDTDSPTGVYKFVFSGNSGNVEYSIHVGMPDDARMYYVNDIQSYYLYNFLPNEEIRLFLYDAASGNAKLLAWENYVVDTNGRLIIKADRGAYFVIGESSGPIATFLINPSIIVKDFSLPEDQTPVLTINHPNDASIYGDHYYKVFTTKSISWSSAKLQCEDQSGHLVVITSSGENDFVWTLAKKNKYPQYTVAWMGATDNNSEGIWKWVTNESFVRIATLDDLGGSYENYLNLRLENGKWEDFPLNGEGVGEQWYICEWE